MPHAKRRAATLNGGESTTSSRNDRAERGVAADKQQQQSVRCRWALVCNPAATPQQLLPKRVSPKARGGLSKGHHLRR